MDAFVLFRPSIQVSNHCELFSDGLLTLKSHLRRISTWPSYVPDFWCSTLNPRCTPAYVFVMALLSLFVAFIFHADL